MTPPQKVGAGGTECLGAGTQISFLVDAYQDKAKELRFTYYAIFITVERITQLPVLMSQLLSHAAQSSSKRRCSS
jgi:hypothetical protein